MSLRTSWIYDPQFDPKWSVASNSCRYCTGLAFSSLRATPADEGNLFFPVSVIAAEKLWLCCHLPSRTRSGVTQHGYKAHLLPWHTEQGELTLLQHTAISIPYVFVNVWVQGVCQFNTQPRD